MDPNQARRLGIDRRAGGMRRQRRATQVTAAAAAAAAVAFGWAFAHATGAAAGTSDPTQSSQTTTGDQPGGAALQPPDQAPGIGGAGQQPDTQSGGS